MKISDFKLFDNVSERSQDELLKLDFFSKNYESGDKVLGKDEDLNYAMFIDQGCLKACEYTISGKGIVSSYHFVGNAFSFYLYFEHIRKFLYDVYAIKKTKVYFLPLKEFEKIMDTDIVLTKNILKFVAEYTCFSKLVIRATRYSKVSQRLACWILHLQEVDHLKLSTSQTMPADILRVNRPSLNQELKKFVEDKAIYIGGMEIRVLDRDYLLRFID